MSYKLVCITGCTGFIGSHTVKATLDAGYAVRLVVRSQAKAEKALDLVPQHQKSMVEYSIVEDLVHGDMASALTGAQFLFHLASPMPCEEADIRSGYLEPAVNGTLAVLSAANACPSIETVVVMSTAGALITPGTQTSSKGVTYRPYANVPRPDLLSVINPGMLDGASLKYAVSKIWALYAMRDFRVAKKPHFKLISLHPVYVVGKDLGRSEADEPSYANRLILSCISNEPILPVSFVAVQDVAKAHIRAIESSTVETGDEFVLSEPHMQWSELISSLQQEWPQFACKRPPPECETWRWNADTRNTEEKLGLEWRGLQTTVSEVIQQQVKA